MAKLVFGMMQSLDGYVAGVAGGPQLLPPGDQLGRHFSDHVRTLAGVIYGRRMYEVMRYWDADVDQTTRDAITRDLVGQQDQPDWDADERDFAAVYRKTPKWVVSRTLNDVGPNATLIRDDACAFVRKLKEEISGEIDVAGPELAASLTVSGLIDEYRLYIRPFVLGRGKPYFAGPVPALRFVGAERVGEDAMRLTYVPGT